MACNLAKDHSKCYFSTYTSPPCGGALLHYVEKSRPQAKLCYVWCENHAKRQGYLVNGAVHSHWMTVPTPSVNNIAPGTAIAVRPATTVNTPEPTCTCQMHVGACVSIGHRVDCAYLKWNYTRRLSKVRLTAGKLCTHEMKSFMYINNAMTQGAGVNGITSSAKVCVRCRVIMCYSLHNDGKCDNNEPHGACTSLGIICGQPMPTNLVTILEEEA